MSPGVLSANIARASAPVPAIVHLVSARAQQRPNRALDGGLIVDEQNSRAFSHHVGDTR